MITIRDWDEAYLNELIKSGEKESLTLEYKASSSLKNQDKEKNELAKDVSAFANSAGGVILYGILEDKHVPTAIDSGVDRNAITKEWLESIVKSHIHPLMDGLIVKQIDLPTKGANQVAYAIDVPQATSALFRSKRAVLISFSHRSRSGKSLGICFGNSMCAS